MATSATPTVRARPTPLRWWIAISLIAMVIAGGWSLSRLQAVNGDVTVFLRVGTYAKSRAYVEQAFPQPILTGDLGHDGQQFYVISSNATHLHDAQPFVDRLRYRSRRILFPLITSPFADGAPRVWAMWGINLLCIGACAVAFGRLAKSVGVTPWFGVVAGFTPALLESLDGSLGDALAFALVLWAVVLWRRHVWVAVVLFTLAALTRETTLVAPAACFILGDRRQRTALAVPFVVFGAWALTIIATLPATGDGGSPWSEAAVALSLPFKGWFVIGITEPGPLFGVLLLVASVIAIVLLRARLPEVALWLAFDLVLLVLSNEAVVERPMNLARVAPLALPAFVLGLFARTTKVSPPQLRPGSKVASPA